MGACYKYEEYDLVFEAECDGTIFSTMLGM
jgi:hypothetical protein